MIEAHELTKRYGDTTAVHSPQLHDRARDRHRVPRPERRRPVIDHAHDHGTGPVDVGHVRVHDLLSGSALLTVDGVGHGAYGLSSCATDLVVQYLLTGAVPAPGTECPADLVAFDS
jgi:hypothetical protein